MTTHTPPRTPDEAEALECLEAMEALAAESAATSDEAQRANIQVRFVQRKAHCDLVMARIRNNSIHNTRRDHNPDRRVRIKQLPPFPVPFSIGDILPCPWRGSNGSFFVMADNKLWQLGGWEVAVQ